MLQGLAPERVVLIGSLGKRLAPGLRLGWMLTPSWLTWALTPALAIEAGGADVIAQHALRDFLARGELDRHERRMRARYAARRELVLRAFARRDAGRDLRHRATWTTSRPRSPAPPSAASGSRASSCTATSRQARAGSCSGWRCPSPRSARAMNLVAESQSVAA